MNDNQKKKFLMDGYVGVKFNAVRQNDMLPPEASGLYGISHRVCERLREHDMTPANGGNLSIRLGEGFVISSSGCNLGCIEENELIYVEGCDVGKECVMYQGPAAPSSESIMHWLIYQNHPEAMAIVHAHDEFATKSAILEGEVSQSEREEPYGTVELARMAIDTFKQAREIIVLKNHGYVAIGSDLDRACDLIVNTHMRLLGKK
ncbi:MAG: class II aldolase/adducin family protein [Nitrospirota bacterium]